MGTETSPPARSASGSILKFVGYAYAAAALAYVAYGMFTETGLFGYLMDLSMRIFGRAYMKITGLVAFIVTMIPLAIVIVAWEVVQEKGRGSAPAEGATMSPSAVDPVVAARRSLRAVLWTGAACILLPWVLGYPAQLWMAGRAQSAAGSTPETIVLGAGQAAGAPKGRFVRLEAVPQGDLVYGVTRERSGTSGSTQYYVPLTSPEWTPQEPVRYFLHFSRHGEPTRDDFDGPYVGEVGADSLPTPVAKEYERAGVTLARPYFVVERIDLVDGKVPDTSENAFAGYVIISAAFTLFGLLLVLGGWIGYRKKMAALA